MKGFSIQLIGKAAKGRPKLRMGERGYKALYRSEHHHFRMSVEGPGNIRKALLSAFSHFSSYKIPTLYIKTSPQHWYPHPSAYLFLPPSLLCRTLPLPLIPLIPRLRKSQASTSYDAHLSHRQNHLPRQNQPPSQDEIDQGSNRTAHRSRCMLV